MASRETYEKASVIRGHHVYKTVWTPFIGEALPLKAVRCSAIVIVSRRTSLHAGDKFIYMITSPEIVTRGIENGIQPYTNVCLVFLYALHNAK